MRMPNKDRPASDNVLDILHHKVGQTITSTQVCKLTGETMSACSAAMWNLEDNGFLEFEKKVGGTKIYRVRQNISERKFSGMKRPKRVARKVADKYADSAHAVTYEIETDVPMPDASRYPFRSMKVGDSFSAPLKSGPAIRYAVKVFEKGNQKKNFTTRKYSKTTVRCWRVK